MAHGVSVVVAIPSLPATAFHLSRMTGRIEQSLSPRRAAEATWLLGEVLRASDGGPVGLVSLPVSIHDRLLAQVFVNEVGDTAHCNAMCAKCSKPFEFDVSVSGLLAAQDAEAATVGPPAADGTWTFAGFKIRPPTLADARLQNAGEIVSTLCMPQPEPSDVAALSAFLERASPLLSLALDASCPHCGDASKLDFDLPGFLLTVLAQERPFLLRETHLIAARYGWSHAEILDLPRDDRRAFAALIESERSAALRGRTAA